MQNKLPADPLSLIFGIIGVIIAVAGCCCYGITAIIPLGLSIYGLIMANRSLKIYHADPSQYSESSRSNVSAGRVLNIIAIILNSLIILVVVTLILILGIGGFNKAFDDLKEKGIGKDSENEWQYEDDFNSDEVDMLEEYEFEGVDTTRLDSVQTKERVVDSI